jgi:7SK snRNA methylphosphate capping enzyme
LLPRFCADPAPDYSGPAKAPASAIHVVDPRLNLLATTVPGLFTAKNCLDIGCNAGGVSCQLGKRKHHPCCPSKRLYLLRLNIDKFTGFDFHAASVTGVDIDPKLVGQADKLLALRASRVRPATKDCGQIVDYFPQSAVLEHGFVESSNASIRFFSADWAITTDFSGPYDVILALSVRSKLSP